jgi:hypothetical protein
MKAIIKSIDINSHIGFDEYCPENEECFGLWLTINVGPDDEEGGHLYQILVCTPDCMKNEFLHTGVAWGRNTLIVTRYDHDRIVSEIKRYVEGCIGNDFWEIAQKVARIAAWEFEDYQP